MDILITEAAIIDWMKIQELVKMEIGKLMKILPF